LPTVAVAVAAVRANLRAVGATSWAGVMEAMKRAIESSIAVKQVILQDADLLATIKRVSEITVASFEAGGKALFCGNGGSAADAQHLAAELSGRFNFDREPLCAEALHVNTSYLTAVANDYSYEEVYARLVRANGRQGDVLFCISTSGNSPNIVAAAQQAMSRGMTTVGMTGRGGGALVGRCTHMLKVPSDETPRIQESHILIGHIICEHVERALFARPGLRT
jgi:D-sedoheptulose 7-phosphate isomerase